MPEHRFAYDESRASSITGERTYQIPSLAVPRQSLLSPDEALKYGAVALFADRVRATISRFEVNTENVKPVVEICRRLDGLPLALELAAARASVLAPHEISNRLDRVFDVLIGGRQASVPRHATMRAVIDWSYALLSFNAKLLLDRLAIFIGSFSGNCDGRLRRRNHCATRRLGVTLVADCPIARHGRLRPRQHALSSARGYATIRTGEAREAWRTADAGRSPRARGLFRLSCVSIEIGTVPPSVRGSARPRPNSITSGLRSAGHSGKVTICLRGVFLPERLRGSGIPSLRVEGRRWVRLAIDSITEETPVDEVAQLYIADAELCGALGESAASLASAEHALRLRSVLDALQVARAEHAAGSALAAIGRAPRAKHFCRRRWLQPSALRIAPAGVSIDRSRDRSLALR